MEIQKGLPLNWTYFYEEEIMEEEELRQSQMLSMELEETRVKAEEELRFRDEQIIQLKQMLTAAIQERDGAQENCRAIFLQKLLLQQQLQLQRRQDDSGGISTVEDHEYHPTLPGTDSSNGFCFSSSPDHSDESIVSSPPKPHPAAAELELEPEPELPFVMALPEKGRLLEAVMKAGPLLQNLLLAGPLPQWRHPPPPLHYCQIPPPPVVTPSSPALPNVPPLAAFHSGQQHPLNGIVNFGNTNRKRALSESSDTTTESKSQKGFSSPPLMKTL